jgi:hypothetical protein
MFIMYYGLQAVEVTNPDVVMFTFNAGVDAWYAVLQT